VTVIFSLSSAPERAFMRLGATAASEWNHSYAHVKHIKDLGKAFVQELEEFFVNYHELSGAKYRIRDARGPDEAKQRIKQGMRQSKKRKKT
jgi:inorganic pyrophosphatase